MNHVVYFLPSGLITKYMRINASNILLNVEGDEMYMVLSDPVQDVSKVYVLAGSVVSKPSMPVSVSTLPITLAEEVTISGIPEGAILLHPGGEEPIDDGEVQWSCVLPGNYTLRLSKFPYLDEIINVQVNPA